MSQASPTGNSDGPGDGSVIVRYWAAARAAAGREVDHVAAGSLAEVLDAVRALHRGNERFTRVLDICSVLVGERPVGATDPATVAVAPGEHVELLPPFAGGDGRYGAGGSAGVDGRSSRVMSVGGSRRDVPR